MLVDVKGVHLERLEPWQNGQFAGRTQVPTSVLKMRRTNWKGMVNEE